MTWIKIEDQHPPQHERVLGVWERIDENGLVWQLITIGQGFTDKDRKFICHVAGDLKHWMPLPFPPQD